jgi:arsenate reductase
VFKGSGFYRTDSRSGTASSETAAAANTPKRLDYDTAFASDVIITMGCGDACPIFPGKRYEDWKLDDPAGKGVDAVRPIRDEIRHRVQALLTQLLPAPGTT